MKRVDIYTSSACSYCHAAKAFLHENNISFIEHNITTDIGAKRELMRRGLMSVPVIIIDSEVVVGFDRKKIAHLLEI